MELREALLEAKQCMGCLHEGILVTTVEGTILESGAAADRILEIPSPELRGTNIRALCTNSDVYDSMFRDATRHVRASNHSMVMSTGGGKRKLVNMSMEQVGDGSEARLVHVFQDCADLQTLEQRLLQAERLATVGRFASQIAHEIRNPLNSISLNIELLEDELNGNQEAKGLIRSALKELDRLNDIVSEYLQFARFPKPHLKRGTIDDVIRDVSRSFKPPRDVEFNVIAPDSTPEIWLDEGLIRQVIDNLIRNSVEAIVGKGSITLETEILDRFLVIRVRDTGIGIPPEVQPKLFEPFFTTKTHGTGLGLATSQQIVFEHNGHLLVESQPGKGAAFSMMLPL